MLAIIKMFVLFQKVKSALNDKAVSCMKLSNTIIDAGISSCVRVFFLCDGKFLRNMYSYEYFE